MRIIAHVDMDAFYAAVEERRNPALRGRPLVVGADPKGGQGRGVVTTANYPARKYGIRSAMPISRAWRLAEAARRRGEPETVFLRGNRALYSAVSERIMTILCRGADAFEEASIDEAYLDLSSLDDFARAEQHMSRLKAEVFEREGLTCSVGIAPNKLVAKIASDFKKPDGLTLVRPEAVLQFLEPLRIRVIPGIGPKSEAFFHEKAIRTVRELRAVDRETLREWLGKWGGELYDRARGISDSPVVNEWEPKSVGEQETFEEDSLEPAFILGRAQELAEAVCRRMKAEGFQGFRTVTVTVRFEDFVTVSRSRTAKTPLTSEAEAQEVARQLLLPFFDSRENPRGKRIRLIGVRAEKLLRDPGSAGAQERIAFDAGNAP
jgi:DNA polymerase IV (DinB-like DNA polymerase)